MSPPPAPPPPNVPENATNLFSGSNNVTFATTFLSSPVIGVDDPCERAAAAWFRIVAELEASEEGWGGLTMTRYGVGRGPTSAARTEGCETERWCKLEIYDFGPGGHSCLG